MLERLTAAPVFGPPTMAGEVTVIPVRAVSVGFGFGAGSGGGPAGTEPAGSSGGGGGGAGRAEPRGYIRITGQEVKFEPIMDQTRVALAGILMVAWNVFWVSATVRAALKRYGRRSGA